MTPPTDVPVYRRILVATGGAPHSDLAVERAVTLALRFGATLDVVTVVPVIANALVSMAVGLPGSESLEAHNMESERAVREEVLARTVEFARSRGLPVTGHLVHAPRPADAILGVARDVGADLI
ncbi:universal stress protein, partial [Deinococcus pimensis]|uniref:universal stress protein n=1 Tax=Deinococcus pimensis TaxID=309888 RepID=UPI00047FE8CF